MALNWCGTDMAPALDGTKTMDAERYRFLADLKCNSLYITKNEHAASYYTAKVWIEECLPESFKYCQKDELQRMKDTDTIWCVQIYPNTPIGFNVYYGATLEAAIDAAIADND
jgi:hypothetical protein